MAISKKTLTAAALTGILVLASGTAAAWCGGYRGNVQNYSCPQVGCTFNGPHNHYIPGRGCANAQQFHKTPKKAFGSYEQRKVYLRGLLNLTDAQKPAFDAYIAAADEAHNLRGQFKFDPNASRQDQLKARIENQKVRLAALEKVAQARADLVKALSAEQVQALEGFEARSHKRPQGKRPMAQNPHGFGPQGVHPHGAPVAPVAPRNL